MSKARVKADAGTHRDKNTVKSQEGQKLKIAYLEVKRRALKYEADNYTQLVLVKTQDKGWWKMFGHSAVMYKHFVAPRLKLKPKLLPDSDYDVKSEEGYVGIADIEKFESRMKSVKIYPSNTTEWTRIYDLGERVSEQDYVEMLEEDKLREEMTNKLIIPKENLAELNAKTKALLIELHAKIRKMDGVGRDVFGNDMEKRIVELQVMVVRTARGTLDVDYCLERGLEIAEDLYGYALVLLNLALLAPKDIYNLTEKIVALEKQIKKEIRKRAVKRTEEKLRAKNAEENVNDTNKKVGKGEEFKGTSRPQPSKETGTGK